MPTDLIDFGLELVFDAVDIGIIVLDDKRRIVGWNDWMAHASGHGKRAVIGKNFTAVFPTAVETRLPSVLDDAFAFGSSSFLTYSLNNLLPLYGVGGSELLHNIIVRPVNSGASKYCLIQVNDVTTAVIRERVLRERQNARYRAIVDTAPDAIITTSVDGTIQWLNGEAEQAFGYEPAELLGNSIDILLESSGKLSTEFAVEKRNSPTSVQVIGRLKRGHVAHFDVSFSRWDADGRSFVTTIWRDISDLVEARNALLRNNEELEVRVMERTREREAALRQLHESQKLESIGQLTGGIAHDFNNLLAVILGNLALLKKNIPDEPRNARLLEGAIQGAERGATLTKRLLAFARRQELKLEAIEIQKLVPDMLNFLRRSVGPNIVFELDIPPDVLSVSIDANQLELALMNLVLNARDAMPNGGTITFSARNEVHSASEYSPVDLASGEYVRLSVADTGEGMSEATLAKATEPFFTTKGVGKGTGLGLPMVHGLTLQAGGAIHIASEIGRGTVVTLWLPRAGAADPLPVEPVVAAVNADALSRMKVLLVDDDWLVRMGAADMLADLGHEVIEVASAAEAMTLLEKDGVFDIVVTDYAMPGKNGIELAREIETRHPTLPIVLATGYAELPTTKGGPRYPRLSKPYTQGELDAVLRAATTAHSAHGVA